MPAEANDTTFEHPTRHETNTTGMTELFDSAIHHRRSIRLRGYDYSSPGIYFVTICAHRKEHLFGEVIEGEMHPTECGKLVASQWLELPRHYKQAQLAEFIVMPNHLHGLLEIVGAGLETRPYGLSEMVRGFKTWSARRVNQFRHTPGAPVWQRNYYEHIVRNPHELGMIRDYIATNPVRWATDPEFS